MACYLTFQWCHPTDIPKIVNELLLWFIWPQYELLCIVKQFSLNLCSFSCTDLVWRSPGLCCWDNTVSAKNVKPLSISWIVSIWLGLIMTLWNVKIVFMSSHFYSGLDNCGLDKHWLGCLLFLKLILRFLTMLVAWLLVALSLLSRQKYLSS